MTKVTAWAPATVANVAVGFDILGFSFDSLGDEVTVRKVDGRGVKIVSISGIPMDLPRDEHSNTATVGLIALAKDHNLDFGFEISIKKGIPLGSGLGGSAASAVASLVAANAFLSRPLSNHQLLPYALLGEQAASGGFHADNIVPCLFGGLTLSIEAGSETHKTVEVVQLPVPEGVFCVILHPKVIVKTSEARKLLNPDLSLKSHTRQSSFLAGFIAGCFESNFDLISHCLKDIVIEPQRAHLIPHFAEFKRLAIEAGALGASISGSGPSVFALAKDKAGADAIHREFEGELVRTGINATLWSSPLPGLAAKLI